MELKVTTEELRKKKLFVATPMYGGQCSGMFAKSTNDLAALCYHYGIECKFYYLFNESLITRARNYCCDEFLRSDSTHMIFIDSDIGFNPHDIITMLAMQDHEDESKQLNQFDILCGPYPKKCISWEKIVAAVNQGLADQDPGSLDRFVGDYVFNPAGGQNQILINEPAEVLEGGTGFMMFPKRTLEKFAATYPELYYRPDHVRTTHFDGSREIMAFFDALIDNKASHINQALGAFLAENPEATHEQILEFVADTKTKADGESEYSNRYLSEDYMFCQWARKAGLKVWLCPWMKLQHVGTHIFGGSLADLAQVQNVSATADPSKLSKNKAM